MEREKEVRRALTLLPDCKGKRWRRAGLYKWDLQLPLGFLIQSRFSPPNAMEITLVPLEVEESHKMNFFFGSLGLSESESE